jgi:hypothetical protein
VRSRTRFLRVPARRAAHAPADLVNAVESGVLAFEDARLTSIEDARKELEMTHPIRPLVFGSLIAALSFAAQQTALAKEDAKKEVSHDGLVRVEKSKKFQGVWLRPGDDLSGYTKMLVLPAEIHYKRPPSKSMSRENFPLSDEQKARLTTAMREVADEEIGAKGGWQRTDKPGPDVLVVRGGLIDLVVKIPPDLPAGRGDTYVTSFGEATLVVELYDSQSMQILARIADRQEAEPAGGRMQSVEMSAMPEVKRVLRRWAVRLREALDLARTTKFPE